MPLLEALIREHDDAGSLEARLSAIEALGVLAHEAVHVAAWILRVRGMPFSFKNEEGVAYLVQWFVSHASPLLVASPPSPSPSPTP